MSTAERTFAGKFDRNGIYSWLNPDLPHAQLYSTSRLLADFVEVDEDTYDYFLGLLPPVNFTSVGFAISEATTGDIRLAFFRIDGRCFAAYISDRDGRHQMSDTRAAINKAAPDAPRAVVNDTPKIKPFVDTDLAFGFCTTRNAETGKSHTVVDFMALHSTPKPFAGRKGLVGEIDYQPVDEDRGFVAPIWLATPARPSNPALARVAFFSEVACTLFLKSQAMEALVAETV